MTTTVKTIHKTYQARGYCSRSGYARIREVLRACRWLYNRSLAQRRNIYRACGKSMSRFAQMKHLTRLRAEQQAWRDLSIQVSRGVLARLDRAFSAFFRRVKAGEKPGFPRFQLACKAEWAGRQLVEVNPAYTSRTCAACGAVNGKPRRYRVFACSVCGHADDRDVNAALNILARGNIASAA